MSQATSSDGFGQRRVNAGEIDRREVVESCAAETDLHAARVDEMRSERLEHARAAVGAGTPPDANNEVPRAGVQCEPDQLSGAARGRV